jgi:protein-tyrosine phosphatase
LTIINSSSPDHVTMRNVSVLFVCLGNICRSPLAEGVLRHIAGEAGLSARIMTGSAGTGGWHQGDPPDRRSIAVAAQNGIDLTPLRARQIRKADFSDFDLILGMDRSNVSNLLRIAPDTARKRVHLFSTLTLGEAWEVPDPYYGGASDFERVYHMVSEGCRSLVERLKSSDMSLSGNTSSVR